mgnify:CR=1 FL=1
MDTELVNITKEYQKLENICKDNYLLNYGRCENDHFIPHYPGLIGDFLPSSEWYNSRRDTLPMYLTALKIENELQIQNQKQVFENVINKIPKLYLIINNSINSWPSFQIPTIPIRIQYQKN